jgi:hypothetical protein
MTLGGGDVLRATGTAGTRKSGVGCQGGLPSARPSAMPREPEKWQRSRRGARGAARAQTCRSQPPASPPPRGPVPRTSPFRKLLPAAKFQVRAAAGHHHTAMCHGQRPKQPRRARWMDATATLTTDELCDFDLALVIALLALLLMQRGRGVIERNRVARVPTAARGNSYVLRPSRRCANKILRRGTDGRDAEKRDRRRH